jgi:hypothetical protein
MNPDRQQALNYLRAPSDGLWRWAEDGAVLVWRDGGTIAFREEIIQLVEWLVPNGLPPFGAMVLLLAACRGKIPNVADIVKESAAPLPPAMGQDAVLLVAARKQLKNQVEAAIGQLARVAQLASGLDAGVKAKRALTEAVFEPAKTERHLEARAVLRGMRETASYPELSAPESPGLPGNYLRHIHIVAEGLKPHTAESLSLRLRTGLDALPRELDANLPKSERARRLIEELGRHREHGAMARAARELMAAIRLPRRLGESEHLPIGGVADITNRGHLDRLLLSELAHDDMVLSARMALNEALYLRREPPLREPPGALALLLDSGVRLWGIPRVLAAAVALALIARDKHRHEILAWRPRGRQLEAVDLLSRDGLTQHLGVLEPSAHPGESIKMFAGAVSTNAQNQTVLITHRDTLDDPEFRRALAENPAAPGYVATVDREGRFELHATPLARRTPLCEADLNLEGIFDDRAGVPPIKTEVAPDLPAIFGVVPFPFLLPVAGKMNFWTKAADGFTYAIMDDRRLVKFRDQDTGARVLASDLPAGKVIWMDCVEGAIHAIKAGSAQRPTRLLSIESPGEGLRVTDLPGGSELLGVHRYGDAIVLASQHDARAFALSDGRLLGEATSPHVWMRGRFFRGKDQFYFALWDGERAKFEPVTLAGSFTPSVVSNIFDRDGLDGPWLIHQSGMAISSATGERQHLPMQANGKFGLGEVGISRDGHRVYVAFASQMKDLTTGAVTPVPTPRKGRLELDRPPGTPYWNMYRVVESIARLPDGIVFFGRNHQRHNLSLSRENKLQITETSAGERNDLGAALAFPGQPGITEHGCSLKTIQCPGGGKVFLDSRRLLHLRSSDSNLPEVSLTLSHGEVAGWTSDGHVCGPKFFFGEPFVPEPGIVFERLKQILDSL